MNKLIYIIFLFIFIFVQSLRAEVAIADLFPYGVEHGDTDLRPSNLDDGSSPQIILNVEYPFFDNLHDSLWVNVNGAISFLNQISTFTPICEPVPQDYRMISPFWADVDLTYGSGKIYYRQTADDQILNKAKQEISEAFPAQNKIQLKSAFIATWENVQFYGSNTCPDTKQNTFQTVLATDGFYTFALFFYNKITWTIGIASGGNCTGNANIRTAKAGFDAGAGDNSTLFIIPGSCNANIITVAQRSNYGKAGKWVFKVDNYIIDPECKEDFNEELAVTPKSINNLGHVNIELYGPCLNETTQIKCRFNDTPAVIESVGWAVVNDSKPKIICKAPFLNKIARMKIEVVLNSESTYIGYIIVEKAQPNSRLNVEIGFSRNDQVDLKYSWNASLFNSEVLELSIFNFNNTIQKWNNYSYIGAFSTPSNGQLLIQLGKQDLPIQLFDSAWTFVLNEPGSIESMETTTLFSSPEFGLEVRPYLWQYDDKDCTNWYIKDFPLDLPKSIPCPPTSTLATTDPTFEIDPECLQIDNCELHPGMDFCVRAINPTPEGFGQQCCYRNGRINNEGIGRGTVKRCHPDNLVCYIEEDRTPWIKCCQESTVFCEKYFERRPSDPGTNYQPPCSGGGTGDPHMTTFDGLYYTYCGAGEFWLIKNGPEVPIQAQSRMEHWGSSTSVTVFTAFALKTENSSTIQIQVSQIRKLDIYIDNSLQDLTDPSMFNVKFDGGHLKITNNLNYITINFEGGFSFQITNNGGWFAISATVPGTYRTKARGLLGDCDGNRTNDYRDPDGNIIPISSSQIDINNNFGAKWRIAKEESIFTYSGKQYEDYNILDFVPNPFDPNVDNVPPNVVELCGDNTACIYDYVITGDASIANLTKDMTEKFNETQDIYDEKIILCPPLTSPSNGYITVTNFFPDSIAEYFCYTNYTIIGDTIVECLLDGTWNSTTIPECVPDNNPDSESSTTVSESSTTVSDPDSEVIAGSGNISFNITIDSQDSKVIAGSGRITFEITVEKLKQIFESLNFVLN